MSKMIFVVGGIHCGTTLTATILGANSKCLLIPMETGAYKSDYMDSQRRAFVRQVAELDAEFIVEKSPHHIFSIRKIVQDFPDAKFVVVTRNHVDTVGSIVRTTGDFNKAVYDCSNGLSGCIAATRNDNTALVSYESIVKNFDKTVKKLCDFIGVEFDESMRNFHENSPQWFARTLDDHHMRRRSEQMRQPLFDGTGIGYTTLTREQIDQVNYDCLDKHFKLVLREI